MFDKYDEDFNFINCSTYEISNIHSILQDFVDEWFINTERQDNYKTHANTLSFFIYKTDLFWNNGMEYRAALQTDNKELVDLLEPIISDLEQRHNGVRGQVLFIKLLANKDIPMHTDKGDYLMSVRRHHIPIVTSPGTRFGVGEEEINMQQGECWEINNSRLHYVINNSDTDRIHLLIDIMPMDKINANT